MLLVGLKDVKTAGFVNVLAVPSVENYKNMVMQDMQKPDSYLMKNASDFEVYSLGEMDGSGSVRSDVQFVCQLADIKRDVVDHWCEWHKLEIDRLCEENGLDYYAYVNGEKDNGNA